MLACTHGRGERSQASDGPAGACARARVQVAFSRFRLFYALPVLFDKVFSSKTAFECRLMLAHPWLPCYRPSGNEDSGMKPTLTFL